MITYITLQPLTILLISLFTCCTANDPYPECPAGLVCGRLTPRGLKNMTYDCAYAHSTLKNTLGNVYLMHGDDGARAKAMWSETMLQLALKGYTSLACDQRGYSPGASPDDYSAYHYDLLATDILALTSAAGFNSSFNGKFHLVAHDQGARIAWHSIAKGMTRNLLLSFSTLSIPHADIFSDNVCCDSSKTDVPDQTALQYFRQLTLPNSVRVNHNTIFNAFCGEFGFNTPEACQKTFWWYNGAVDSGAMAMAPLMDFGNSIASRVNISFEMVRKLTTYPLTGVPQTVKVGAISNFPVFFACGNKDTCDLCTNTVVEQTKNMITSTYTSTISNCGHKLLSKSKCPQVERQKVIDGIVSNIMSAATL
jgi:hypothetical protein